MTITYKTKRKLADDDKLAPQELEVYKAISAYKNPDRETVIEKLEAAVSAGAIKTRQAPSKLLDFYQKRLIEKGLVEKTVVNVEKPDPKTDKRGRKAA